MRVTSRENVTAPPPDSGCEFAMTTPLCGGDDMKQKVESRITAPAGRSLFISVFALSSGLVIVLSYPCSIVSRWPFAFVVKGKSYDACLAKYKAEHTVDNKTRTIEVDSSG